MRKKVKYSLTAKQRKQQRKDQLTDERKNLPQAELTEEEKAAADAEIAQKKQRKSFAIRLAAIVMAMILAIGAITTGIVLMVLNSDVDQTEINPVATITLTDGNKIEIELLYKESCTYNEDGTIKEDGRAPIANFIYLAENKFFDNTIFSNSLKGFLAFEGYTDEEDTEFGWLKHKGKDEDYIAKLPGFSGNATSVSTRSNKWNTTDYKLGYRLKYQSPLKVTDKKGYLAMLTRTGTGTNYFDNKTSTFARGSSTGFIMIHDSSAQLQMGGSLTSSSSNYFTYIGKMEQKSIDVLQQIASMETLQNPKISDWAHPKDYKSVMIKTVRISKLNKKLRNNIINNFEDFVIWSNSEMEGAMKGHYQQTWSSMANGYWKKV